MKHVSAKEVDAIHDMILQRYGGGSGCADPSKISALMTRVANYAYYENVTDVFELAAMYWVAITKGHAYVDGNKKAAIATCLLFLRRNGIKPYNRSDLVNQCIAVAAGTLTVQEAARYLCLAFSEKD